MGINLNMNHAPSARKI